MHGFEIGQCVTWVETLTKGDHWTHKAVVVGWTPSFVIIQNVITNIDQRVWIPSGPKIRKRSKSLTKHESFAQFTRGRFSKEPYGF